MKKTLKILTVSSLAIVVLFNLGWVTVVYFCKKHAKKLYDNVQNHDEVFIYETFSGPLNSVVYIDNLKDSSAIINFYEYRAKGIDTTIDLDEIKTMPLTINAPIYILSDLGPFSRLIEVIDFDTTCWGYIKGYVCKNTVHKYPPSDSLIKQKEDFFERQRRSNKAIVRNRPNTYGFYCKSCCD